jgi:glycosyltransferase involved in cell wall biosynthesis
MEFEVVILTEEVIKDCPLREEFAELITYPRTSVNKLFLPILPIVNQRRVKEWIRNNKQRVEADVIICRDPVLGLAYMSVFPKANIVYIPAVVIKYYNKGIRKAQSLKNLVKEVLRYSQLKIEERQQKRILEKAQKVIVFSNNVKSQLLSGSLCEKEKITVCYPGVSDKFICQEPVTSFDNSFVSFVFVGRLVAEKNLSMLINAFSQLHCKNKRLVLVGDGYQRCSLENQVKELSLTGDVLFVGESKTPEKHYRDSHFFVIPSSYESFGQVIIEALSSGLPVIGFSTIEGETLTAIDELIVDGETGFICKEFSSNSLRNSMERAEKVLHAREEYYKMKSMAIKFTRDNCSWSNLARKCLE